MWTTRLALPLPHQPALDVHQAAGIGDHQGGRSGLFEIGDLAFQEFRREFGVLHREDAAETAAILPFGEFDDLGLLDRGQKRARLAVHAQAAQEMTGRVIGQFSRPAGG